MNSIFRVADNFQIKDVLNLLSQALTKDWQWKESKNDWRLMQTFSRFNIINKFFMNENLLAIPGSIRNIAVINKKVKPLIFLIDKQKILFKRIPRLKKDVPLFQPYLKILNPSLILITLIL